MKKISRRNFFKIGISAIAAFGLVNNPLKLIASNSPDDDWVVPEEGRVSFVSGEVFINNNRGDVGDIVEEGDVVTTGDNSEAEIEIRDYSVFHIKENSTVLIEDVLLSPRVEVKKGWFLAIIKRETQFDVGTPLVLAGVRGMVLFVNVLNDEEVVGLISRARNSFIIMTATYYRCLTDLIVKRWCSEIRQKRRNRAPIKCREINRRTLKPGNRRANGTAAGSN